MNLVQAIVLLCHMLDGFITQLQPCPACSPLILCAALLSGRAQVFRCSEESGAALLGGVWLRKRPAV